MKNILTEEYKDFLSEWGDRGDTIYANTSGSTGIPKEIFLKKADMRISARATNQRFGIISDSVLFSPLSSRYIAGKMMLVRAAEANCRLITEHPSSHPLQSLPEDCRQIDLMCVVPSQVESLLKNKVAHNKLKNLIVGGAPLSPSLEKRLELMPWKSFITYGMTETCSHVALRGCGRDIYSAMPGITFSTDLRGCLIIHSQELSFRKLKTNDIVELKNETEFIWLGRADFVINSGGLKFHPEKLEQLLCNRLTMPFYIHSKPHPIWGESVAITIEDSSGIVLKEDVLDLCREVLPKYAVPREVRIVEHIARTISGKLIRS